jgi:hypothetical protein
MNSTADVTADVEVAEKEEVDFAKYVRPLRVPAENCQEEVLVLLRRHVVTSTGLFLPEHLACNDSNLTRHEVVRIPDSEDPEKLGFDVGDFVFISTPSGFQKPQCAQPLDTDPSLLLFSNKFIVAVDERPREQYRKPGDFYKTDA